MNTCWAADAGDPEVVVQPLALMARKRRGEQTNLQALSAPEAPIENCVRVGYFKDDPAYACRHQDGCLHGQAEMHRPKRFDPPPAAFLKADGRDPKRKLGRTKPVAEEGFVCVPVKPRPRKERPSKKKPARGKRRSRR
jgi:hypothetical protein